MSCVGQARAWRALSSFPHLSASCAPEGKYRHTGTVRVGGHCLTVQLKIVPSAWTVCPGRKACFSLSFTVGLSHLTKNTPWAKNKRALPCGRDTRGGREQQDHGARHYVCFALAHSLCNCSRLLVWGPAQAHGDYSSLLETVLRDQPHQRAW